MGYERLSAGQAPPEDINVVIEIPAQAAPVKYEFDKAAGMLVVDRFLSTSMVYPCNYGFVPKTLCEDGDPVDVLVVTPLPLVHGCLIACRPVDLLAMRDEHGVDNKVLAVPRSYAGYADVGRVGDFRGGLENQIRHFFEQYKAFEPGKWAEVGDFRGIEAGLAEIKRSIERYAETRTG
ncbi:MAG: inorganic diphosphatase [Gammaproteobacteria bacterium]